VGGGDAGTAGAPPKEGAMRLILRWKDVLQKVSGALVSELAQMVERINAWAGVEHNGDGSHKTISVEGLQWVGTTQTTVGAAGGASALPATPTGYLVLTLSDATEIVVPYYTKA
jgi:hypothetical protein